MKKTSILALLALATLACSNSYNAKIPVMNNTNDSINYAIGLVNGAQIRMQQLNEADEKSLDQAATEFVDALQRGWDGKVEKQSEAARIGHNIGSALRTSEEKGLADNPAWTLDEKVFFQGLINGIHGDESVMDASAARDYFQKAYQSAPAAENHKQDKPVKAKCVDKPKTIELQSFLDSVNYAFGLLNGDDIGKYVLEADSDGTMRKELIEAINKSLSSKNKYPQLVQLGEQIGKTIKDQSEQGLIGVPELTTDFELIKQGFINGIKDFGEWDAVSAGHFIQEAIEDIKNGTTKAAGEAFLASNALREGVIVTESGLQYEVLKEGKGEHPTATDRVKVHYHGTLIDGTVFDSSVDRGEPITFALDQVIAGWTEGVQLMTVGSKYKFYIPQELGYGCRAAGHIPPCSALIFEVELLAIE